MNNFGAFTSRTGFTVVLTAVSVTALAQEAAKPPEVTSVCPSVIATVMIGKVSCSATLCNTGASQGGWLGLATQIATRGSAIDGASFSAGFGAQLATALKQTGCFTVVDAVSIEQSKKEMEALGRPAPPTPTVDFLVRSDITKAELVVEESGFLAYKTRSAKTTLALDAKVVSASTGTVSEAGTYESLNEKKSSGVDLGIYRSGDDSAKRATPFADVSREVIVKAVMSLTPRLVAQISQTRSSTGVSQQVPAVAPASTPDSSPAATPASAASSSAATPASAASSPA